MKLYLKHKYETRRGGGLLPHFCS